MIQSKAFDLEYLKTRIIPLDRDVLISNKSLDDGQMKNIHFPRNYLRDLIYITKLYGCEFRIVKSEHSSYNRDLQRIRLAYSEHNFIPTYDICKVFTHELAHHIQRTIAWEEGGLLIEKLSESIKYERIAERLAYFINKLYFNHIWDLHHSSFSAYRSKSDQTFLAFHHHDMYDDLALRN